MRIRQLALVARDRDPLVEDLRAVFELEEPFEDPGVATFGLENAVFAVGDTFLEVVSPVKPDTSAGRFLARRGGDGGYMVILQSDDLDRDRASLANLGVRIVWEIAFDDIATLHLHPRDTGGAILSLDQSWPPASWRWAGPDWASRAPSRLARRIVGAELEADDPDAMAKRWSEITGHAVTTAEGTSREIALEASRLHFVASGERGEGLGAIEIEVADAGEVLHRAKDRGLETGEDFVMLAGVRIRLV